MNYKKIIYISIAWLTAYSSLSVAASDAAKTPTELQSEPLSPASASPESTPSQSEQEPSLAPLPSSHEMTSSYENAFIRMLVTLGGLILLVFGTIWILRRLGRGKFKLSSSRSINIVEKRPLSQKSMLYLVEIDHKKILISESHLEVRTLTSLEEESASDNT